MPEMSLDANPDPFYEIKHTHLHEDLANLFTKQRIKIVQTIHQKKPKTVSELAKLVQRNISAVYRDLKILENHEIILLEKQGKHVCPKLRNSHLSINLAHGLEPSKEQEENNTNLDQGMNYIG